MAPTTFDSQSGYITVGGYRFPLVTDSKEALNQFRALSDAEKTLFTISIAQVVSEAEVKNALKETAKQSTIAIREIDALFTRITTSLQNLPYDRDLFLEDFAKIQQAFRTTVDDSRKLAIDTSVYARKFDISIVRFCADPDISVDERKSRIQRYIDEAAAIETEADEMRLRFQGLKDSFAAFTGRYSTWANAQEGGINETLKVLGDEIKALEVTIAGINGEILVLEAEIAAHKVANAAWWFLLSPIAGAIALAEAAKKARVQADKMAGLLASRLVPEQELSTKQVEVEVLKSRLKIIEATRAELVAQGKLDLEIFDYNVTYLENVFLRARNDAYEIRGWLQDGADDAKYPDAVEDYLNQGVRVYTAMAEYLKDYADGIVTAQKSFK